MAGVRMATDSDVTQAERDAAAAVIAPLKAGEALANLMQSTDPGDAVAVGMKGYPAIGDTKEHNGDTATFDGRMWVLPSGKPAW